MNDELVCWRCGAAFGDLPLPLARRAECLACHTELHVCRMCLYYDTAVARSCREPVADEVQDKVRANFCGYFTPRPQAFQPGHQRPGADAQARLEALFGGSGDQGRTDAGADIRELDKLFRPRDADGGDKR